MTLYAGETVRISTGAKDFDDSVALVDADISLATVKIYTKELLLVLSSTMEWRADLLRWVYHWNTGGATPQPAGTYYARVDLFGASIPFDTFEIKRIALRKPKV